MAGAHAFLNDLASAERGCWAPLDGLTEAVDAFLCGAAITERIAEAVEGKPVPWVGSEVRRGGPLGVGARIDRESLTKQLLTGSGRSVDLTKHRDMRGEEAAWKAGIGWLAVIHEPKETVMGRVGGALHKASSGVVHHSLVAGDQQAPEMLIRSDCFLEPHITHDVEQDPVRIASQGTGDANELDVRQLPALESVGVNPHRLTRVVFQDRVHVCAPAGVSRCKDEVHEPNRETVHSF